VSSKLALLICRPSHVLKEEQLKGRPGYEHLDDPLHILIEAELPANVIDSRIAKAQEILEELLKPVVCVRVSTILYVFSPSICSIAI
jgi:hypothetical protein